MSHVEKNVIAGRIRRIGTLLLATGIACFAVGVVIWASEPRHGFVVENNRDDSYRTLDFAGRSLGLYNTIRTCAWEPAPVEEVPASLLAPEGRSIPLELTLRSDVISSRLVYGLQAECIAPTILSYSDYDARLLACGDNAQCLAFQRDQSMIPAYTIALRRVSYLDCRDHAGDATSCSERRLLSQYLQSELQRLNANGSRSARLTEEDASALTRSCTVITGEICRQQSSFVRSDWRAAANKPLSALGWWAALTGFLLLLLGPSLWTLAGRLFQWTKG